VWGGGREREERERERERKRECVCLIVWPEGYMLVGKSKLREERGEV
jgi:anti-sigma factor ChrR (cupin superfamily)